MALVVVAACAVLTLGGFVLKAQCAGDYERYKETRYCVNDLQVLYRSRGLVEHPLPYVHGSYRDGRMPPGTVEYPVLTGLFAWLPALVVHSDGNYLAASSLLLAPFSLATALLLARMVRWRALVYALAPPLVWYSFLNWDLLVVVCTVGTFAAWWRGRPALAAVLLAVGACLKLWPGFFIVPLVVDRLRTGDRAGTARCVLAFGSVLAAVNGPFLVVNPPGWWSPYAFQQHRPAGLDSDSIWFWVLPHLSTAALDRLIPVLLLACFGAALASGLRRPDAQFPFVQVCGSMLVAFMLLNKAHSPQYALWLLPFFVLLRVSWHWWAAYLAVDATLFFGLFRLFYQNEHGIPEALNHGWAKDATLVGIWGRALLLVALFVVFLRGEVAMQPPRGAGPGEGRSRRSGGRGDAADAAERPPLVRTDSDLEP